MVRHVDDIKLYGVQDLHKALGVNERTVRDWFNKKRLRGVKIGKEWFVAEENLRAFLSGETGGKQQQAKARPTRQLRSLKQTRRKMDYGGKHTKKQ